VIFFYVSLFCKHFPARPSFDFSLQVDNKNMNTNTINGI